MNDNISDKDKDWDNFISGNQKLNDKDFKNENIEVRSIDFGYNLEDANKVEKFITKVFKENIKKLIAVTVKDCIQIKKMIHMSKDLSILRYSVPEFINKNKFNGYNIRNKRS